MPEISASNSITAKIRAKLGACLTEQNYHDMLSLGSVAEVATYLKTRTKYADALSGVQESALHRGNLELMLYGHYLREMSQLCLFERSVGDKMAEVIMRREEMRVILDFLRYLASGHPEDYMLVSSAISNSIVSFDISKMVQCRNLSDLAEVLGPSPFAKAVSGFAKQKRNGIDFTMLEAVFNRELYCFERDFIKSNFSGNAQKELLCIIGMRSDLQNVARCYRSKKYYHTPNEILLPQLIDAGHYINKSNRIKMAQAQTHDEVREIFCSTHYGEYVKSMPDAPIGELAERIMYKKYIGSIRMSTSPAVASVCYTGLMSTEIRNITTIIEGVRYSVPQESIKRLIIIDKGG
mgnify:CR=1 FL=1